MDDVTQVGMVNKPVEMFRQSMQRQSSLQNAPRLANDGLLSDVEHQQDQGDKFHQYRPTTNFKQQQKLQSGQGRQRSQSVVMKQIPMDLQHESQVQFNIRDNKSAQTQQNSSFQNTYTLDQLDLTNRPFQKVDPAIEVISPSPTQQVILQSNQHQGENGELLQDTQIYKDQQYLQNIRKSINVQPLDYQPIANRNQEFSFKGEQQTQNYKTQSYTSEPQNILTIQMYDQHGQPQKLNNTAQTQGIQTESIQNDPKGQCLIKKDESGRDNTQEIYGRGFGSTGDTNYDTAVQFGTDNKNGLPSQYSIQGSSMHLQSPMNTDNTQNCQFSERDEEADVDRYINTKNSNLSNIASVLSSPTTQNNSHRNFVYNFSKDESVEQEFKIKAIYQGNLQDKKLHENMTDLNKNVKSRLGPQAGLQLNSLVQKGTFKEFPQTQEKVQSGYFSQDSPATALGFYASPALKHKQQNKVQSALTPQTRSEKYTSNQEYSLSKTNQGHEDQIEAQQVSSVLQAVGPNIYYKRGRNVEGKFGEDKSHENRIGEVVSGHQGIQQKGQCRAGRKVDVSSKGASAISHFSTITSTTNGSLGTSYICSETNSQTSFKIKSIINNLSGTEQQLEQAIAYMKNKFNTLELGQENNQKGTYKASQNCKEQGQGSERYKQYLNQKYNLKFPRRSFQKSYKYNKRQNLKKGPLALQQIFRYPIQDKAQADNTADNTANKLASGYKMPRSLKDTYNAIERQYQISVEKNEKPQPTFELDIYNTVVDKLPEINVDDFLNDLNQLTKSRTFQDEFDYSQIGANTYDIDLSLKHQVYGSPKEIRQLVKEDQPEAIQRAKELLQRIKVLSKAQLSSQGDKNQTNRCDKLSIQQSFGYQKDEDHLKMVAQNASMKVEKAMQNLMKNLDSK